MELNKYSDLSEKIEEHLEEELIHYETMLENILNLEKDMSRQILISFLAISLLNNKIMLKKEEISEDGNRKH